MKSLDDKTYELIEQYLEGGLPSDEAAQLEKIMEQDRGFRKEVNWVKAMSSLHQYKREFEVLDEFKRIHNPPAPKLKKWWLLAAAAALVLLYFIWPFIFPISTSEPLPTLPPPTNQPVNQAKLPPIAYDLIELRDDMNVLGEEEDKALDNALLLEDEGKHIAALPYFQKYFDGLSDDEEDPKMRLEVGKIYLKKTV